MSRTNGSRILSPRPTLFRKAVSVILSGTIVLGTLPETALALPHGGAVTKGSATMSYGTSRLLVSQSTSSASFSWSSYNVKSGQSVVYSTPGAKSVSLNFIGGTGPAQILGSVRSNGILEFMDANGLVFGSGSTVSASGVMAFGSKSPWGAPTGSVTNAGTISASNQGPVALVGTSVSNSGTITAPGGEVILAAGATVTPLSQTGSSSLSLATTGGGSVTDSGTISVETVGGHAGSMILQSGMDSGTTSLAPTAVLDASAPNGGNGGSITVNGHTVVLDETAPLNVSSPYGTPGTITIDPTVTDVGTASALEAIDSSQTIYLNNANVCIALTANINMGGYSWTPLGTSSTSAFTGTFNGNGYVVSNYTIGTSTTPYAGGNDVGFIGYLGSGGKVENLGVSGTIYASNSLYVGGVVGFNEAGTVDYSYNTGNVSGGGIVGGVVGCNGSSAMVEYAYNTGNVSGGGAGGTGGVVGSNCGTVEYSYSTGSVGYLTLGNFGGVVGYNGGSAMVEYSYNAGSVSGSSTVSNQGTGGVVGSNFGTVEYSYNTGRISGSNDVGGVVGYNHAKLYYTCNSGSVSGGIDVGGVIGQNQYNLGLNAISNKWDTTASSNSISGVGFSYATGTATDSCTTQVGGGIGFVPTFSYLGLNTTWSSTGFSASSIAASPWVMGTVTAATNSSGGTAPQTAPILIPDMPQAIVTANNATVTYTGSAYSGTPGVTQTVTMGGTALSTTGVTYSYGMTTPINAGSYTITPGGLSLSHPAYQTSVASVLYKTGTLTIETSSTTPSGTSSLPTFDTKPIPALQIATMEMNDAQSEGHVAQPPAMSIQGSTDSGTVGQGSALPTNPTNVLNYGATYSLSVATSEGVDASFLTEVEGGSQSDQESPARSSSQK